ncbi:MAG: DUF1592 domain-containing protein [Phycisphaerales bacterium JB063]
MPDPSPLHHPRLQDARSGRPRWLLPAALGGVFVAAVGGLAVLGSAAGGPDPLGRTVVIDATAKGGHGDVVSRVSNPAPAARLQDDARDPQAVELERRLAEDVTPLLEQYCYECHGNGQRKGRVSFDGPTAIAEVLELADDWAAARDILNDRLMPPEDSPQPTAHEILTINQWIDDALEYYPPDAVADPGWYTIHRLNKNEYRNTLRDLLGIDPEVVDIAERLPPDDTGYGFDNNADVLSMSPLQVEQYLSAAEHAIELAIGSPVVVNEEPVRIRRLTMEGGGNPLDRGGFHLYSRGTVTGRYTFDVAGEYVIHLEAWGDQGGDEPAKAEIRVDGRRVEVVDIPATRREPGTYEVPIEVDAGEHRIEFIFINDYYVENEADRNLAVEWIGVAGPMNVSTERSAAYNDVFFIVPNATDDGERIEGAPGRRRVTERQAARMVIEQFASRAFRRPVSREELASLQRLYEESRSFGDTYEEAVKLTLTATLVSPNFLYRPVEHPTPNDAEAVYTLSDYELASRLSYFLWSSMPDARLLELAERGQLNDEQTLRDEVQRMLADPRSDALVENFAGQWLLLRNLDALEIDRERYTHYDDELREAMRTEAELFFADVLRRGRPMRDLLVSRDTFLNQTLAEHYGIAGVRGDAFRRVELPAGSPRGGVLTMGAVLTVTSNPTRTSPVKRGLYVLEQVLGTPPPPPPPDVPPLEKTAETLAEGATLREQLAAHLADPNCAVCHVRMDPIGLSMEHFDATGAWRDRDGEIAIDAAGELPGGIVFDGSTELKQILLDEQALFIENLTKKMMTYALGRGVEPFDRPIVHGVVQHVRANDDKLSAMIEAIVLSDSFRTCRGREVHND